MLKPSFALLNAIIWGAEIPNLPLSFHPTLAPFLGVVFPMSLASPSPLGSRGRHSDLAEVSAPSWITRHPQRRGHEENQLESWACPKWMTSKNEKKHGIIKGEKR
jgi:hypothetical protein